MNINQKDIEIIDAYLKGDLSVDDTKTIEKRLDVDADFAALYQWLKIVSLGNRHHSLKQKLELLRNIEKNKVSPQKTTYLNKKILWILLLVPLIIFIWAILTNQNPNEISNENTFETTTNEPSINESTLGNTDENITEPSTNITEQESEKDNTDTVKVKIDRNKNVKEKPEIYAGKNKDNKQEIRVDWEYLYNSSSAPILVLRTSNTKDGTINNRATDLFLHYKFSEAINLLSTDTDNQDSKYLLAHCFLRTGEHAQAASIFKTFTQNELSIYYNEARWYYILALYADYPTTMTQLKAAFQNISDMPDTYQEGLETIRKICKC